MTSNADGGVCTLSLGTTSQGLGTSVGGQRTIVGGLGTSVGGLGTISLNNRPHGNLVFEHEIDQVFVWLQNWNLNQMISGIVRMVKEISLPIKRTLRTILEPLLHRDFVYHNFETGPGLSFSPISTFITRELYEKLEKDVNRVLKRRQKETFRLKSAHLKTEVDVKNWSKESILPNIKVQPSAQDYVSTTNHKNLFNDKHLHNTWKGVNIEQSATARVSHPDTTGASHLDMNTYKAGCYGDSRNQTLADISCAPSTNTTTFNADGSSKSNTSESDTDTCGCNKRDDPDTKKKGKRPSYLHKPLFQSPSHAMSLVRSKTQLPLPNLKPLQGHRKVSTKVLDDVFNRFPLSLKANRRHLQTDCYGEVMLSKKTGKDVLSSPRSDNNREWRRNSSFTKFNEQICQTCKWLCSWTEWQQEYFMRMFLKLLTSTQLYFMYALLMVQLYCDIVSLLPNHLSLRILSHLRPKNLVSCAKVCRRWHTLSLHDELWEEICIKKDIEYKSPFFKCYSQYQKMNLNWRDGRYSLTDFMRQDQTVTSMDICEDLLATGSSEKLIKIWKISQAKCIMQLEGHQKCVWALQFVSPRLLISCSNDQTIKIWNLRTGYCTRTILGHEGAVWCLRLRGEYFVSGSSDKTAKVWTLRSCTLVRTLGNHPGGVYSVAISEDANKIFTGTIDKTVRIWHMKSTEYTCSLAVGSQLTPLSPVSSLSYDKGYLWCACNNEFQVWDVQSYRIVATYLDAHKRIESGMIRISNQGRGGGSDRSDGDDSPKGRIISCGKDGKLKIWNLVSTKPTLTIFLPEDTMHCVLFDDTNIFFSCHGGKEATVKVANFSYNI